MTNRVKSRKGKTQRWRHFYMCICLTKRFLERYENGEERIHNCSLRGNIFEGGRILRLSIYTPIKASEMLVTECDTNP